MKTDLLIVCSHRGREIVQTPIDGPDSCNACPYSGTIRWSMSGLPLRIAVVELIGWCTAKGKANQAGRRIAKTDWSQLTPAAKNVLSQHGVKE